jgi:hypothetical protein
MKVDDRIVACGTYGENRTAERFFVGKPEVTRPLVRAINT